MNKVLVIPMHVDALFLSEKKSVAGATTEFADLPYNNGKEDVNYEVPYISEIFLSKAFEHNSVLPKGVHIHWALPKGLVSGVLSKEKGLALPLVPDRWLVIRKGSTNGEKAWIVESSYQYAADANPIATQKSIVYPVIPLANGTPYVFLGRAYELDKNGTLKEYIKTSYIDDLTAMGYGDPAFAGFYPNCHSVFGFHDDNVADSADLSYEIFGWYRVEENDPVFKNFDDINKFVAEMMSNYQWQVSNTGTEAENHIFKCKMACYGIIKKENFVDVKDAAGSDVEVTIGNTGTEALSAFLSDGDAEKEKLFESIQLFSKLAGTKLDLDQRIFQGMHEKGFSPVESGLIWNLNMNDPQQSTNTNGTFDGIFELSETFAKRINELNVSQQQYDKTNDEINSLRYQLYADWYKYMVANYHSHLQETRDTDRIRDFIGNKDGADSLIKNIEKKIIDREKDLSDINSKKNILQELVDNFNTHKNVTWNKVVFEQASKVILPSKYAIYKDSSIANTYVANFNGAENIFIRDNENPSGKIAGIAMWVYIDEAPTEANSFLFRIKKEKETLITIDNVPGNVWTFFSGIYIDGIKLDINKSADWDDIPKGKWTHLYFTVKEMTAWTSVTFFNLLKGSLGSVSLPDKVLSEDDFLCDRNVIGLKTMILKSEKGPRYWQPNEPVLLVSGNDVKEGERQRVPATLNCVLYDINLGDNKAIDYKSFPSLINFDEILVSNDKEKNGPWYPDAGSKGEWNPVLLQWEMLLRDNNMPNMDEDQDMEENFITSGFNISTKKGDLDYKKTPQRESNENIKLYSGTTVLSSHAKKRMTNCIDDYLKNSNAEGVLPVSEQEKKLLEDTKKELEKSHYLSQSVGSFNAALLQMHQAMQLPTKDPMAFACHTTTEMVKEHMDGTVKHAPLPLFQFNPIRTGSIKLNQLAIIDNFGQVINVSTEEKNVKFSQSFCKYADGIGDRYYFPPRIVQPARINFRWLSATDDTAEMNDHPATSPVCGWIIINNLDKSLLFYDTNGYALGCVICDENEIDKDSKTIWKPVPGQDKTTTIVNTHLESVKAKYIGLSKKAFTDLIALLNDILHDIDPENFEQHMDLAMLMGRPIAVVRASVSLEIKGAPAINQGWDYFNTDLKGGKRTTNNWENVKFPVMIGEPGILNDGILGFFKESKANDNLAGSIFQSVNENNTLELSVTDEPINLTMLIDPRGLAHVTSGILPSKSISIPSSQFKRALKNMNISFFTRPLLTPADNESIHISLPDEKGYTWSWISKENGNWKEVLPEGIIDRSTFEAAFTQGTEIWNNLVEASWITTFDNGAKATINPTTKRQKENDNDKLTQLMKDNQTEIENQLYKGNIVTIKTEENFSQEMIIREGWLKLTPIN